MAGIGDDLRGRLQSRFELVKASGAIEPAFPTIFECMNVLPAWGGTRRDFGNVGVGTKCC
jgi:hypothetical protein